MHATANRSFVFPTHLGLYSPREQDEKRKTKNVNGLCPAATYSLSLLEAVRRAPANIFNNFKLQHLECSLFARPSSTCFKDTSAILMVVSIWKPFFIIPRGLPLPMGPLRNTLQDLRLGCTAHK